MSSSQQVNSNDTENCCVVCFKCVDVYSVGVCDHPVCFECSTRMRVLCNQFECPICRQQMPKVFFTKIVRPYQQIEEELKEQKKFVDLKYGLQFDARYSQQQYFRLLEHECYICIQKRSYRPMAPFRTFKVLQEHMRRSHGLQYCQLCVDNLKIFTFERRCYNPGELNHHFRKGDTDNTSHRGHPLCEFCNVRFMDNDDLYRHLRRDHLYCHFCDADGKHQYYNQYNDLRKHYLEEHFLCEEGDCKHEQFTSVFRTDIDLKAHCATVHNKNLSKAANRQARTLELEFTLAPRMRPEVNVRNYHRDNRRTEIDEFNSSQTNLTETGGNGGGDEGLVTFSNPLAPENFPQLGGAGGPAPSSVAPTASRAANFTIKSKMGLLNEENFPSLRPASGRGASAFTITTTGKSKQGSLVGSSSRQPSVTITRTMAPQSNLARNSANFPALGGGGGSVVKVNIESKKLGNAGFPGLGKNAGGMTDQGQPNTGAWVQVKKKHEVQQQVQRPVSQTVPNSSDDFPALKASKNGKNRKSTSVTVPISNSWVNLNSFNNDRTKNGKQQQQQHKNDDNQTSKGGNSKQETNTENIDSKTKKKKNKGNGNNNNNNKLTNGNILSENFNKLEINNTEQIPVGDKTKSVSKEQSVSVGGSGGGVKKRTELNLQVEANNPDDTVKPPPGFKCKPPPGFRNFPLANDMTFTSSSGQSYAISPVKHPYCHPTNFESRNHHLAEQLATVFNDSDVIRQFRMYSSMFMTGDIDVDSYYEICRDFTGQRFADIFPELLTLLPNIERQQELYQLYRARGEPKGALEVCANCAQVLISGDLRGHLTSHTLDNHFPVLAGTEGIAANDNNNVWHRK